ncbi:MAG: hypothetical protein JWN15_4200, partial [Firmicutes bacterium]|nr:hypothetical protein [Bacillota bacterium]
MQSCPYVNCIGQLAERESGHCTACDQDLVWCLCGTANRVLARFCRQCRSRLRTPHEWRLPKGDPSASNFLALSVPFAPTVTEWRRIDLPGELRAQFVYGHRHLFFPVRNEGVLVYRERDLQPVARVPSRSGHIQALALTDEFLLVAGTGGIEAVPLDQVLGRTAPTVRILLGTPLVQGRGPALVVLESPQIACAVTESAVHGIPLQAGEPAFETPRIGQGGALLVRAGEGLVVVEESGDVWGLQARTGARLWHEHIKNTVRIRAGVAAWQDRVYFIDSDGTLVMVHAGRGVHLPTSHLFGDANGLACNEQYVFVTGSRGLDRCIPAGPYAAPMTGHVMVTPPLVTRGTVFAVTGQGELLYTDALAQGERHRLINGVTDTPSTSPVLAGKRIYIGSERGEVVAYDLDTAGGAAV